MHVISIRYLGYDGNVSTVMISTFALFAICVMLMKSVIVSIASKVKMQRGNPFFFFDTIVAFGFRTFLIYTFEK